MSPATRFDDTYVSRDILCEERENVSVRSQATISIPIIARADYLCAT